MALQKKKEESFTKSQKTGMLKLVQSADACNRLKHPRFIARIKCNIKETCINKERRGIYTKRDNIATTRTVSAGEWKISNIDLTRNLGIEFSGSAASFAFRLSIFPLFSGTLFMRPVFPSLFMRAIVGLDATETTFHPGAATYTPQPPRNICLYLANIIIHKLKADYLHIAICLR